MAEMSTLSLTELIKGLENKEFSSVEVTQAYLKNIQSNKDLNAFTEVNPDRAIEAAQKADKARAEGDSGKLLGVPVAYKDIILTQGYRTTCGSKMLENFQSPYDATVTEKLNAAGSFCLGKTNMDEFAMGSSNETAYFGPVKNPWDKTRVPGGSSGGSAAAVAGGLCPIALGTDTGGSIRQPAALCGVVGLKPTYGRVSRYGIIAYASSLDQVGPIGKTVEDCALLSEVICGRDPRDATSSERTVPEFTKKCHGEPSLRGLRVGVPKEFFVKGLQPIVEDSVRKAISHVESLGASVVEISLPHAPIGVSVYYIVAPAEASSNLARYDGVKFGYRASEGGALREMYEKTRSEGFGREVKRRIMIGTYVLSSGYYDAFYLRAQKVRTLITEDFNKAFTSQCDVILSPTAPSTAFKLNEKVSDPLEMYLNDVFTIPVNLAGLPGMSIPCGFDEQGLPIGLQLIGRPWDEETLFQVASAYERTTDWHTRKPSL